MASRPGNCGPEAFTSTPLTKPTDLVGATEGEVEDFDASWQDYDELKRTDVELENAAVSELAEMIYNSVKYNDLEDMMTVEIIDL